MPGCIFKSCRGPNEGPELVLQVTVLAWIFKSAHVTALAWVHLLLLDLVQARCVALAGPSWFSCAVIITFRLRNFCGSMAGSSFVRIHGAQLAARESWGCLNRASTCQTWACLACHAASPMQDVHCFMPCAVPGGLPAGISEQYAVNMKRTIPEE